MGDVLVAYEKLKKLCSIKLQKAGVPSEHANIVADVLVHADARGVTSHGVLRTEHYVKRVIEGGLNTYPSFSIKETGPVTAIFDGDDGFGHVISKNAMDHAIELAKKNGIGMVSVINSSHCGALSYFVNQAAEANLIGMAMTQTDKLVVPFGGAEPYFGTNPIAYGFPAKKHQPVILDMATSNAALGKILHAREAGKEIPNNWGVDQTGKPSTDPNKVTALLPFGGPKGYGLAMVVDILSGIMTGSAFGPHIKPMYGDYNEMRKLGHFYCVIDPAMFTDPVIFMENMDGMIDEIHDVQPAEGFNRVMVPGEPEQLREEGHIQNGVPVTERVYNYLVQS
ncbi:ureidoglycolate dehydrogenase [Peribacillus cavernae]|uniref:Ureidoglycolate dehydrogenase n=1 Tax=Peribacillus cavernae TaxID=1674310 RepID=A0A433HWD5_9BACI|nr:ureidoglycolate dehydrogenase [Peribacillus cavernae]MDQ0218184.1 ureidoglycolate dehydrogenase (NAD+) [Peribacillus cavernae]RUQ32671.1 ureidoglycolate dehydrogenase [Peribacillus cavernae]